MWGVTNRHTLRTTISLKKCYWLFFLTITRFYSKLFCVPLHCYLEYLSRRKKCHRKYIMNWRYPIHVVVISRVMLHYQMAHFITCINTYISICRMRFTFSFDRLIAKTKDILVLINCKWTTVIDIPFDPNSQRRFVDNPPLWIRAFVFKGIV